MKKEEKEKEKVKREGKKKERNRKKEKCHFGGKHEELVYNICSTLCY